jgi:hypothetical protein
VAFQGSLDELPLPDIIQLVSVSGKTGVFDLRRGGRTGQIFLRDGQIVHAHTSRLDGDEAVYELATWSEGEFSFTQGQEPPQRSIDKSNTNLLMEAARRIDEWKILSKRIPSTAHIPMFVRAPVNTSVSFSPQEWAIVCRVDGRRSIEDIALGLGHSPFETCKHLYGLLTSGLLDLREDLFRPLPERLRRAEPADLQQVVAELDTAARRGAEGVGPPADKALDAIQARGRADLTAGRGTDAVLEMVRAHEDALIRWRGAEAARGYLVQVRRLLGAPEPAKVAAQPA